MAVLANKQVSSYAMARYHKILRTEVSCGPKVENPCFIHWVGSYFSKVARDDPNSAPLETFPVKVPFADIVAAGRPDPRTEWYLDVMASPLFAGLNPVSDEPEA